MRLDAERPVDDLLRERPFRVGDVSGMLWRPAATTGPVPLVLMGHPGGLAQMRPRLEARARSSAMQGFASATIEMPGAGERPASAEMTSARADLRDALRDGGMPSADIIDRLILPFVAEAVPEWRATLEGLSQLDEIGERVGFAGGATAVGVRLAVEEPRIVALGLFAGSFLPQQTFDEARRVSIPVHMLLQWDDEGNDRQAALDLFDALGSREKTLQANLGGHRGVPAHAGEDAARFFARHLVSADDRPRP